MKVRKKTKRKLFMVSVTLAVIVILEIGMLFLYNYRVNVSIRQQVLTELEKESMKAKGYLQSITTTRMNWLRLVAEMSGGIHDKDEKLWKYMITKTDSDHHRLGIFDNQGTLYYEEDKKAYIGDREYYKRAMEGEEYVSSVLSDEFSDAENIVLAMPMYDEDGNISGGVAAEYTTDSIGDFFEKAELKRHTASIIFDCDGKFVSSYEDMEKYDSVYEWLGTMQYSDPKAAAQVRQKIENQESGYLEAFRDGRKRMIYYQPAELADWTIFTVAEMETYEKNLNVIMEMTAVFTTFSFLMIASGIFLTGYIVRKRNMKFDAVKKDELSGVYTRLAGKDMIKERFARRKGSGCFGCLFLDLDDFKTVNDRYGHARGDELIESAGQILKESIRKEDIVFRYGGDEFCVWLFGDGGREDIEEIAERILENAAAEESGLLSFSIGATLVQRWETDYHQPLERADKALYEAKEEGKRNAYFIEE